MKKPKRYKYVHYSNTAGLEPKVEKARVCLRCDKPFKHEKNRVCDECNLQIKKNGWDD